MSKPVVERKIQRIACPKSMSMGYFPTIDQ
jgi:hypothetical protein